MDRRSWLWRRKSSEKSPGETESSGSISSHSERLSDDQAYPTHSTQSPEVSSKAASNDEEVSENVKALTEKLSAALLNISAKEDLVKQHAKVAEEAVSGWEKAEKEVSALKQKLEGANQKNSALEDRIGHLDGALKECVRQLRQAREEQEKKIHEVIAAKTNEWDSLKSGLESQLVELQAQLQSAKTNAAAQIDYDMQTKLDAAEKENSALKLELLSQGKELKISIIERDLSIRAAETASKQHLESIKKVAKLEAECRRLKAMARKAFPIYDGKCFSASSFYLESFTDSQSDSGERLLAIESDLQKISGLESNEGELGRSDSWPSSVVTESHQIKKEKDLGRNLMVPSVDINLMDDFLEMEKLAALPDVKSETSCLEAGLESSHANGGENPLKADLEAMINRTSELEDKLERNEAEKVELEIALTESRKQLEISQSQLLKAEKKLQELQRQLVIANESKRAAEEETRASETKRGVAESQLRACEAEVNTLVSKVGSLEEEVRKEQSLSADKVAKCQKLEKELLHMKHEAEVQRESELQRMKSINGDMKIKQEKELVMAAKKFAECQKTIASLGQQLKSLATLDDILLDYEKPVELSGNGLEPWKLRSSEMNMPRKDCEYSKVAGDWSYPSKNVSDIKPSLSVYH
ncbi:filament-like plant protein [Ziziphus jujuba]|uniref:Filament-like plant protein n=3 Tax=Ziziphus jujuba TaxID=326968 RepID=A0A6P4AXJ5_ZIZJJ|nr:filament-like plant protein [Ziziphus jujuba]XP_015890799.3 filament-like plant protein [Ziziphus jujuba]XP_048335643.2 filament-like plant protein [Ziziphus jujuba]XP_060675168.1 filament-like plant protein [Ziziphus jujuba]